MNYLISLTVKCCDTTSHKALTVISPRSYTDTSTKWASGKTLHIYLYASGCSCITEYIFEVSWTNAKFLPMFKFPFGNIICTFNLCVYIIFVYMYNYLFKNFPKCFCFLLRVFLQSRGEETGIRLTLASQRFL